MAIQNPGILDLMLAGGTDQQNGPPDIQQPWRILVGVPSGFLWVPTVVDGKQERVLCREVEELKKLVDNYYICFEECISRTQKSFEQCRCLLASAPDSLDKDYVGPLSAAIQYGNDVAVPELLRLIQLWKCGIKEAAKILYFSFKWKADKPLSLQGYTAWCRGRKNEDDQHTLAATNVGAPLGDLSHVLSLDRARYDENFTGSWYDVLGTLSDIYIAVSQSKLDTEQWMIKAPLNYKFDGYVALRAGDQVHPATLSDHANLFDKWVRRWLVALDALAINSNGTNRIPLMAVENVELWKTQTSQEQETLLLSYEAGALVYLPTATPRKTESRGDGNKAVLVSNQKRKQPRRKRATRRLVHVHDYDVDNCQTRTYQQIGWSKKYFPCPWCDAAKEVTIKTYKPGNDASASMSELLVKSEGDGFLPVDIEMNQPAARRSNQWNKMRLHLIECLCRRHLDITDPQTSKRIREDRKRKHNVFVDGYLPPLYHQTKIKFDQTLAKNDDGGFDHVFYREKAKERKVGRPKDRSHQC